MPATADGPTPRARPWQRIPAPSLLRGCLAGVVIAVLLEAGSISNRDEEVAMQSPERQDIIASGVTEAVKEFCDPRWAILGPM